MAPANAYPAHLVGFALLGLHFAGARGELAPASAVAHSRGRLRQAHFLTSCVRRKASWFSFVYSPFPSLTRFFGPSAATS